MNLCKSWRTVGIYWDRKNPVVTETRTIRPRWYWTIRRLREAWWFWLREQADGTRMPWSLAWELAAGVIPLAAKGGGA
jgi:hypothetical protein